MAQAAGRASAGVAGPRAWRGTRRPAASAVGGLRRVWQLVCVGSVGKAGGFVLLLSRALRLFKGVKKWPFAQSGGVWGGGCGSAKIGAGAYVALPVLKIHAVDSVKCDA